MMEKKKGEFHNQSVDFTPFFRPFKCRMQRMMMMQIIYGY